MVKLFTFTSLAFIQLALLFQPLAGLPIGKHPGLCKRVDSTALTVGLLVACPPLLWICVPRACAYCVKQSKPEYDLEANRPSRGCRPYSWPQTSRENRFDTQERLIHSTSASNTHLHSNSDIEMNVLTAPPAARLGDRPSDETLGHASEQRTLYKGKGKSVSQGSLDLISHEGSSARPQVIPIQLGSSSSKGSLRPSDGRTSDGRSGQKHTRSLDDLMD
ncbi:hypothetical protein AX14_012487 [Amanita brunnescens Koide BX004]|nr:hypothetical protein AX14_012487 [Amanita brunnescens Koide BX004]